MTDEQLMAAVRDGEVGRLGDLFERHGRLFYGYFVRLTGNPDASHDLLQEMFLRILKYRHTYRGLSTFKTWGFRIARNLVIVVFSDHRRSKMKRTALLIFLGAFVLSLPASHLVLGKGHVPSSQDQICHFQGDDDDSGGAGVVKNVDLNRLQRFLRRGDCLLPINDPDHVFFPGDRCTRQDCNLREQPRGDDDDSS